MAGLISWGTYVPVWKLDKAKAGQLKHSGGRGQISVPGMDEDAFTMGLEAANMAMNRASVMPDAIYFASNELPAQEQNPAAMTAYSLGFPFNVRVANFSGSALAGTEALLSAVDFVDSHKGMTILVIASEAMRVAAVDSRLELLPGAGAAAFIVGGEDGIAKIESTVSSIGVFPDMWTNEDGYLEEADNNFRRQKGCAAALGELFKNLGIAADYLAYSQPEENTLKLLRGKLKGVSPEAVSAGEFVEKIGDISAAAPLFSLAKVLEQADAEKNVVVLAYGAGSSAAITLKTTGKLKEMQLRCGGAIARQMDEGKEINYVDFLSLRHLLKA